MNEQLARGIISISVLGDDQSGNIGLTECGLCTQIEMNAPGNGVYPLNPGHCFVKGDSDSVRFVHVLWRGNSMLR